VLDGANRGKLRQVLAIRLRDVENEGAAESDKLTSCFGGAVAIPVLVIRRCFALANDRRKNINAFFSFANMPAKPEPGAKTCYMSCVTGTRGAGSADAPGMRWHIETHP
jgi:hypothetical protein